jgi:hypothetical protein
VRWQGPQVPPSPSPSRSNSTQSPSSSPQVNARHATAAAAARPQTLLLEHPTEKLTEEASRPNANAGSATTPQTSLVAVGGGSFTLVVNQPAAAAAGEDGDATVPEAPVATAGGSAGDRTPRSARIQAGESAPVVAPARAPAPRVRPSSAHPTSRAEALAAAKQRQAHAAAAHSPGSNASSSNSTRLVRPQSAGFRRPGSAGANGGGGGSANSLAVRSGFAQGPRAAWSPQQLGGRPGTAGARGRREPQSQGGGSNGLRNSVTQTSSLLGNSCKHSHRSLRSLHRSRCCGSLWASVLTVHTCGFVCRFFSHTRTLCACSTAVRNSSQPASAVTTAGATSLGRSDSQPAREAATAGGARAESALGGQVGLSASAGASGDRPRSAKPSIFDLMQMSASAGR